MLIGLIDYPLSSKGVTTQFIVQLGGLQLLLHLNEHQKCDYKTKSVMKKKFFGSREKMMRKKINSINP